MLVSVIIPFYRSERYIERCARSLFEQTYEEIEYLFVNDASDDGSLDVLKKVIDSYPARADRVRIITHERNRGSAIARSSGLREAKGDYVIQVDSDDYTDKTYIEKLAAKAVATDADVVICEMYYLYPNGRVKPIKDKLSVTDKNVILSDILSGVMHNSLCNKLMRRSIFVDNGIDFIENVNMFDDKSVVFRSIYFSKKIERLAEPLYYYDKNNPNSITSQSRYNEIAPALKVLNLIETFFSEHEADAVVRCGISKFRASVKGLILLHDKNDTYKQTANEMGKIPREAYLSCKAQLPLHYKVAIMLDQNHCGFLLKLLRNSASLFSKAKLHRKH